ncbi:MAG: hypothetical protein AVDCRST_MAG75-2022, partial [uncultured Propionibacteriaceae bacterium]
AVGIDRAICRLGGHRGWGLVSRQRPHRLRPDELPARLPEARGCRLPNGRVCPPGILGDRGSVDVLGAVDGLPRVAASRRLVCLRRAHRRIVRFQFLLGLTRHPHRQRSGRTDMETTKSQDYTSRWHRV